MTIMAVGISNNRPVLTKFRACAENGGAENGDAASEWLNVFGSYILGVTNAK